MLWFTVFMVNMIFVSKLTGLKYLQERKLWKFRKIFFLGWTSKALPQAFNVYSRSLYYNQTSADDRKVEYPLKGEKKGTDIPSNQTTRIPTRLKANRRDRRWKRRDSTRFIECENKTDHWIAWRQLNEMRVLFLNPEKMQHVEFCIRAKINDRIFRSEKTINFSFFCNLYYIKLFFGNNINYQLLLVCWSI